MANQTPVKIDPTTGLPARFSGSDTITESLIADEAILARVAANEVITGNWEFQNSVALTNAGLSLGGTINVANVVNLPGTTTHANATTSAQVALNLAPLITPLGASLTSYRGINSVPVFGGSIAPGSIYGYWSSATLDASLVAGTNTNFYAYYAHVLSDSSSSASFNNVFQFYASNVSPTPAGSVYGFYSGIAAGTGRWGFYGAGTAKNAMVGALRIGDTTEPTEKLEVAGNVVVTGTLTVGGVPVAGAAIVGITDYSAASNTLALGDALNLVRVNYATSCTLTIPPNSSVAFPLYTCIPIKQHGAGQLTLVAGAGVTLNTPWSLIARAQHSILSVFQESTNVWTVAGDMW